MKINAFEDYFLGKGKFQGLGCQNVQNNYFWPTGDYTKININYPQIPIKCYDLNVNLRGDLNANFQRASNKQSIADWVVKDWGKIKTNSPNTLQKHLTNSLGQNIQIPIKGIASYTMMLMAQNKDVFPIYTSPIAVSLNCIQLIQNIHYGTYFKIPLGSKIHNKFRAKYKFQKVIKTHPNWVIDGNKKTYIKYLCLLNYFKRKYGFKIYEMEMALFADSKKLIHIYDHKLFW